MGWSWVLFSRKKFIKSCKNYPEKYKGIFPTDITELESLPGIGGYTSAAILSFAFNKKIPAIDTNISKILSVLWPKKKIIETARILIELSDSGKEWNSAMMDLASFLRTGKAIHGDIKKFFPPAIRIKFIPKRSTSKKKSPKPKDLIEVGVACIYQNGKYLIQSRPEDKSFSGLWEFPGGKREKGEDFRACVKREIKEELGIEISVRPHFYEKVCKFKEVDLYLRFHRSQIQRGIPIPLENQTIQWVAPEDFQRIKFLPTNLEVLNKLREIRG